MTDTTHPQERDIALLEENLREWAKITHGIFYIAADQARLLVHELDHLRTQPSPRELCPHDGKPCYVGATPDDLHHRCGTVQCGREDKSPREVALEKALQKIATYFSEEGKIATAALASSAGEKYDMG